MGYLDPNHAKLEDLMDIGTGPTLFVDTVAGSATGTGRSWEGAYSTMALAFADLLALHTATAKSGDNATIYARGVIAEQISCPLGVSGVRVIGAAGGRSRHDNGIRWKEAAVPGNAPLCIVHEQGWEFHNLLFVPQATYSALKFWRAEDAVHPDGSHAIVKGCYFVGDDVTTPQGIGVEDYGGHNHMLIEDNEFQGLDFAIKETNAGISSVIRWMIRGNTFRRNKNDIGGNFTRSSILNNTFDTPYHGTTHPIIINLAYTADESGRNVVHNNIFPDIISAIDDDHGYIESTGDIWGGNWASTSTSAASGAPWGGVPADS